LRRKTRQAGGKPTGEWMVEAYDSDRIEDHPAPVSYETSGYSVDGRF
jgi:hypothetical protein